MKLLPAELILEQMELGPMENFLYYIGCQKTKEIAVVDPAWDVDYLCDNAAKKGYKITKVFLTHGHSDHVNGLDKILKRHDVPAYISKHEADFFKPKHKNIVEVSNHEKLKIGNLEIECIHTPGHSPGCHVFHYKNAMVVGDLLFIDGCGRCDLPGSDPRAMYKSLYGILMKWSDDSVIFPGHNYGATPSATLGQLKKTNPYLTCKNEEEFLVTRMGL